MGCLRRVPIPIRRPLVLDPKLQLALREQPTGPVVMRQKWRDLLFLHYPCDPAEIQRLLPEGLSVDTYPDADGVEKAWIGLVPFLMKDVRLGPLPPLPGASTFEETNVRTYVHREGRDPGVWFFSLDAANRLAVLIARLAFALPYHRAELEIERSGDRLVYVGRRGDVEYRIASEIGRELASPLPGSLEFFLVERYLLYAARGDRLSSGRVHHSPYRLRSAVVESLDESLVGSNGLTLRHFSHVAFCEGVDVEIFPLRTVEKATAR